MRALDTNLLARLVTGDDPRQVARVKALLDEASARGETLYVSEVVVCELAWVLRKTYGYDRLRLVAVLRELTQAPYLHLAEPVVLKRALAAYAAGRGDFADYVIRERALAEGCEAVVTFDRALHGEPGFVAPA